MSLPLGETAPDFTADSTQGTIRFHDWSGNRWIVFFSHPKDFTPVCTTELGEFARRKDEFERRNALLLGLSVDSVDDHQRWSQDVADVGGAAPDYPLLADPDLAVAKLYGMFHPKADPKVTVRSVFIIDPQKKVRLTLTYPPSAGRNVDEVLRVLDSLQLTDGKQLTTPVGWEPGDDVIIAPSVSDEEARKRYPDGWRALKPYLRLIPADRA
ncbi:peroxiredoxin [Oleiagrimonas soli]|uniref:Thioredoxin peroxidase n=1 Tax=Oleiagrimonas soli TaxID=1543381 RepID=A0A099D075_9GAMM|nr:peroxiredoxin [Oleiagrimonas soli]KGI78670.1 peroxidase [Oleiagrimonas soli]MBB6184017.1 peroxiredoxin (alkyl hydroperoxide reductase subunit C) [Oleiagrimonas soli]